MVFWKPQKYMRMVKNCLYYGKSIKWIFTAFKPLSQIDVDWSKKASLFALSRLGTSVRLLCDGYNHQVMRVFCFYMV